MFLREMATSRHNAREKGKHGVGAILRDTRLNKISTITGMETKQHSQEFMKWTQHASLCKTWNTPETPRNTQEHPQNTKIMVSGQNVHEKTDPKTFED